MKPVFGQQPPERPQQVVILYDRDEVFDTAYDREQIVDAEWRCAIHHGNNKNVRADLATKRMARGPLRHDGM